MSFGGDKSKYGGAEKEVGGFSKAWNATKDPFNWQEMKMGKNCHPDNCTARYNASKTIYGKVANAVQYGVIEPKDCAMNCTYNSRIAYAEKHGTSVPSDVSYHSEAFSEQPWIVKK